MSTSDGKGDVEINLPSDRGTSSFGSVAVYCGASDGFDPAFAAAAAEVGRFCAGRSLRVVYGGAATGLMGVVANAALDMGGEVVGVIPKALERNEVAHTGLSQLYVVETMHERKRLMSDMADAFVALPGGFGTAEEIFEVITWMQLGIHSKPLVFVNVAGFFDPLRQWIRHASTNGFIQGRFMASIVFAQSVEEAFDALRNWQRVTPLFVGAEGCWNSNALGNESTGSDVRL